MITWSGRRRLSSNSTRCENDQILSYVIQSMSNCWVVKAFTLIKQNCNIWSLFAKKSHQRICLVLADLGCVQLNVECWTWGGESHDIKMHNIDQGLKVLNVSLKAKSWSLAYCFTIRSAHCQRLNLQIGIGQIRSGNQRSGERLFLKIFFTWLWCGFSRLLANGGRRSH